MSTYVSTDPTNEVHEQLQAMFAAAQTTLRQREEGAFVAKMKAEEERIAYFRSEWAEPLQVLTSRLPEWIYPYIEQPLEEYEYYNSWDHEYQYAYIPITVPGCQPIAAWVDCGEKAIRFDVMQPKLEQDESDGIWCVRDELNSYRLDREDIRNSGERDIAITLFHAHDAYLQRMELMAQAEERNAAPKPAPVPPIPDPIDQARELVRLLSSDELVKRTPTGDHYTDTADSRTLVLAGVGMAIAYHISRVADALEESK